MNADFELIQQYLNGNSSAFEQLYNRYRVQLYSYIYHLLGSDYRSNVDDIYQQTWIDAIKRLAKFKDNGSFYSWLIRIGHSRFIDHCRKNKIKFSKMPEQADSNNTPGKKMILSEQTALLNQYIDKLSPEMKEVVLLRQDNIPFKEIADIQKVSINTVLSRMNYALKKLKKMFLTEVDRGQT